MKTYKLNTNRVNFGSVARKSDYADDLGSLSAESVKSAKPAEEEYFPEPFERVNDRELDAFDFDYTPQETEQERAHKRVLLRKLKKYYDRFANFLEAPPVWDSLTLKEVEELLEETRLTVSNRRTDDTVFGMFIAGSATLEQFGPLLGLNLQNYTNGLLANPEVKLTCVEVALEKDIVYIDPTYRLMMLSLQTAMLVHKMNSEKALISPTSVPNSVPDLKEEVVKEFADI